MCRFSLIRSSSLIIFWEVRIHNKKSGKAAFLHAFTGFKNREATKMQAEGVPRLQKTLLQKVSLSADGHSMSHTHATHPATEHHATEHAVHLT